MAIYWYVLRSKPNREEFLEGQLLSRNYEVFYPRLRVKPVNPRSRKQKPYFPGYLFLHTDLDFSIVSALERIPGVANLVSFGGEPSNVPDWVIHEIRAKVEDLNLHSGELQPKFPVGAMVKIDHGPFAGYEGIIDERLPGKERVRVLLKMLQDRQIPVDLPITDVSIKKSGKPSGR